MQRETRLPTIRIVLLGMMFVCCAGIAGQTGGEDGKWTDFILELVETINGEQEIENLYNDLSHLLDHPININASGREVLERYPFLSDNQIDELLLYIEKNGALVDPYELRLVPLFDYRTVSYLIPFIFIGERTPLRDTLSFARRLKYGKHELMLRSDYTFQQKKGFSPIDPDELDQNPNARYQGEPFYHHVKYSFSLGETLQAGLLAEKDMGEPLFANSRRGYDFYSPHLVLRKQGALKILAVGHYRLSFGQGVIINSDFSFGKSSIATSAYKRSGGIKRHFSTDENNYLQGAAATFLLGEGELSTFYSIRSLDGSANDSTLTSIKTNGLHNLQREEEKRNAATMQLIGANYQWRNSILKLGLTALYYSFSKSYEPTERNYNANYFRGKENFNIGVNYELQKGVFKLFGETALSKSGGVGSLNGLQLSPIQTLNISVLQRYYATNYHAYFSKAFGEASQATDEQGIYMAAQWSVHRKWNLSCYMDVYRFSTAHYGIDAPSEGYDYQVVANFIPSSSIDLQMQYRHRAKPTNYRQEDDHFNQIVESSHDRLKMQLKAKANERLSTKTTLEGVLYNRGGALSSNSGGWVVSQQVSWQHSRQIVQFDLFGAYFDTDDYYSRLYSAEKALLYTFSKPSFNGKGIRIALNVKIQPHPSLALYLKYARSSYFDRESIGTALDEIIGCNRDDIYLLVKWKF